MGRIDLIENYFDHTEIRETIKVLQNRLLLLNSISKAWSENLKPFNRWLIEFYGISTFVGYLTPNLF